MALCGALQDLNTHTHTSKYTDKLITPTKAKQSFLSNYTQSGRYLNHLMRSSNTDTLMNMMAYVFDVQRVACDPLHGFQQEAGQRHAFAPVVCGDFLMGAKDNVNKHIENLVSTFMCVTAEYLVSKILHENDFRKTGTSKADIKKNKCFCSVAQTLVYIHIFPNVACSAT